MVTAGAVRRGDVFLVGLDPTRGSEIRKTRPCVIVSPDELNSHLRTFISC
jgi:mRNA interferase MazF